MSIILNINGTDYPFPEDGDESWGPDVTDWAQAVTNGMLQKAGGEFLLLSEIDFGGAFGLKSAYYKSRSENVASSGQLRFAREDVINFRNTSNDSDLSLAVDEDNDLTFNGAKLGIASEITNDEIAANAGIEFSKLQTATATSLLGRSANSSGSVAPISASTNGFVLRRSANALSFGLLINENIDEAASISVSKLNGLGVDGHVLTIESNVAVWKEIPPVANGSITEDKLASDSVTTAKIKNLEVTEDKLANNSVTASKILNGSVDNTKLRPFQGNVSGDLITDTIYDQLKRPLGGNSITVNSQGRPFAIGVKIGGAQSFSGTDRIACSDGAGEFFVSTTTVSPQDNKVARWYLASDSTYAYPISFDKFINLPDGETTLYLYFYAPSGVSIVIQNAMFYAYEL